MSKTRCFWCLSDPLYIEYHDKEWGCPIHDDPLLFEFLILEGMQAGLSWLTVLKKRPSFREAFAGFDPQKVAEFSEKDVERLLKNPGIIRNGLKIRAAINNAKAFLEIQKKHTTFDRYIWQFTDGKTIQNAWPRREDLPSSSPISDRMSKDLKQQGFKFVGTTICYAFMQAVGMVNDHITDCFRYKA